MGPFSLMKEEHFSGAMRMWRLWKLYYIQIFQKNMSSLIDETVILGSYKRHGVWLPGVNKSSYVDNRLLAISSPHGYYGWNNRLWAVVQEERDVSIALSGNPSYSSMSLPYSPYYYGVDNNIVVSEYLVFGTMLCFGKMVVGRYGVRASYAVPESFILNNNRPRRRAGPGIIPCELLEEVYKMHRLRVDSHIPTGLVPWVKPLDIDFWPDTLLSFIQKYPNAYPQFLK